MLEMRRMQRIFSLEKIRTHLSLWTSSPPPQQGFPVAHVQLLLPVEAAPSTSPSAPAAGDGALEVSNFPGGITIKGAGIEVEVSFELKALERSPHRALLQPPFQPSASSFPFFFAVFDSSLRAASYALVRITCNPNSDHVQPQLATLSTPSSLRSRPGPASSRAGPSPALTSWPSPSCPASTALPLTTTAAGPGATATPTGAGLGGKERTRIFGCLGAMFCTSSQAAVAPRRATDGPFPSHPNQLLRTPNRLLPSSIYRWKEAGLDRMAVVSETVKLEAKTASEGCVKVRSVRTNARFWPIFHCFSPFRSVSAPLSSLSSSLRDEKERVAPLGRNIG